MELKIKKLREGAHIPKRATAGSAGMDLYACIPEAVTLAPGQLRVIPTGIAIELPDASCAGAGNPRDPLNNLSNAAYWFR